jgi:hypothetical protein
MSLLRVLKLEFAPPLSLHAWVYLITCCGLKLNYMCPLIM